jgi:tRNA (guanosine-2'-O-)-methyltransferase
MEDSTRKMNEDLLHFLYNYVSENRQQNFQRVIDKRTRYMTIVLENIYQPHNASAVLRSCDLFGIQDVHIIENKNPYKVNPDVAMGSSKWLNLYHYRQKDDNTLKTFEFLRRNAYKIVATTPHKDDFNLDDLPLDDKIALVFGNELDGLSKIALQNADMFVKIPMHGFTESFNISVSASIIMHHLTARLHKSNIAWQLSEDEKNEILLQWSKRSIKMSKELEAYFLKRYAL